MSLKDYEVKRDKFALDECIVFTLSFPCCSCRNRAKMDYEDPCRTCDHNANAVREDDTANPSFQGGGTL